MKHTRKRATRPAADPVVRRYIARMLTEHHLQWQQQVMGPAPDWELLLGLHLRMIELEGLEQAAGELL